MAGRGTPATGLVARQHVAHRIHEYVHDARVASYGAEAAAALGVPAGRVFKTLVVTVDGALTLAVLPVATTLDLKALAAAGGGRRADLADPVVAERATGYVRGGISPLGGRRHLPVVLDSTATGFDTVYVSAGRRGLELELAATDLVRLTGATVAPIGAA